MKPVAGHQHFRNQSAFLCRLFYTSVFDLRIHVGGIHGSHDFNSTLTLPADEEEPADSRYGATVPQATRRGMTRTGTGSRGSTKVVMKGQCNWGR